MSLIRVQLLMTEGTWVLFSLWKLLVLLLLVKLQRLLAYLLLLLVSHSLLNHEHSFIRILLLYDLWRLLLWMSVFLWHRGFFVALCDFILCFLCLRIVALIYSVIILFDWFIAMILPCESTCPLILLVCLGLLRCNLTPLAVIKLRGVLLINAAIRGSLFLIICWIRVFILESIILILLLVICCILTHCSIYSRSWFNNLLLASISNMVREICSILSNCPRLRRSLWVPLVMLSQSTLSLFLGRCRSNVWSWCDTISCSAKLVGTSGWHSGIDCSLLCWWRITGVQVFLNGASQVLIIAVLVIMNQIRLLTHSNFANDRSLAFVNLYHFSWQSK